MLERLTGALAGVPGFQRVTFAGCPLFSLGEYAFAGVFEAGLALRVDEKARTAIVAEGGSELAWRPGSYMGEFVVLPESVTDRELSVWVQHAQGYVRSLPSIRRVGGKKSATISRNSRA